MARVIQNLGRSVAQRPQDDIYIVYFNPQCADVLDAAQFLQRLGSPVGRDNTILMERSAGSPRLHKLRLRTTRLSPVPVSHNNRLTRRLVAARIREPLWRSCANAAV